MFKKVSRKLDKIWVGILGAALLAPSLYWWFSPAQQEDAPNLSWPEVLKDQHFFAREEAFAAYRPLKEMLRSPVLPQRLVEGDSGFLFLGNFFNEALRKSKGFWRLSNAQLALTRRYLEQQQQHLRKQNTEYIVALAPNKSSFYGHRLPIIPTAKPPLRQQLDSLLQGSPVPFVALLQKQKPPTDSLLYYRYDSHWNHEGAWRAYREIMAALRQMHPQLPVLSRKDLRKSIKENWQPDLSRLLLRNKPEDKPILEVRQPAARRVADAFTVPKHFHKNPDKYERRFRNDSAALKIVVLHDSFFNALLPWFAESFGETVYLWTYELDTAVLAREKPDIVLHFMVERNADVLYRQANANLKDLSGF